MSKLIVEMEMPKRCIECGVRLKCKRYVCGLYQDIAEDLNPLMCDKDCLIKGELVRCYECVHKSNKVKPVKGLAYCDYQQRIMYNTDFCNHGERKEQTDAAD